VPVFRKIFIPLDGSKLAEAVLPAAYYLAGRLGAVCVFFHVIEKRGRTDIHGERHLADPDAARSYLEKVGGEFAARDIKVEMHVHEDQENDVARSILDHCGEFHIDLVMLTAHGFGGLRDVFVGNIPRQLIAHGRTPVFFVKPGKHRNLEKYACGKILLPLDTTVQHEASLGPAMEIAKACLAGMKLVCVVPTVDQLPSERAGAAQLLPRAMEQLLDLTEEDAIAYLKKIMARCEAERIKTTAVSLRGKISRGIISVMKEGGADLLVIATHGRTALDSFWSGSLTGSLIRNSTMPILLVRAGGEEPGR